MRRQAVVAVLFVLIFAGLGSSALAGRSSARSAQTVAIRQEKRLGPKPLPHWFWRWVAWRLGEGYAKGNRLQPHLRPTKAPHHIDRWAWRRLHFFLVARRLAGTGPAPGGATTYAQAISYTSTPPAFTAKRTIPVTSASELQAAISGLRPGDLVKATANFTVTGETVIRNRLSAPAELELSGVEFVYQDGANRPAVWLDNARNLFIYGGDLSTADTGGTCLLDFGSQNVLWWGFSAHDCGGSGFAAFPVNGSVSHDDFAGEITKVGQNLQWDPHTEKGTGVHGAILWDSDTQYALTNNRFAFYAHDISTGACVELGDKADQSQAGGNVLYEKCVNETEVAHTQTGGNGLQLWGYTNRLGLDVQYLEVDNAQGYAVFGGGVYPGQTLSGVTVEDGRAANTNLNPRYRGKSPWDSTHGIVLKKIQAAR